MISRRGRGAIGVTLATSLAIGCTAKDNPPRVPLGQSGSADAFRAEAAAHSLLGPAAKAALDSGNVLFRQNAYSAALAQYQQAAALAPQHSAPLFGIYMVARATNNRAMADSALAAIRQRNGPMPSGPHAFSDSALRQMHDSLLRRREPNS